MNLNDTIILNRYSDSANNQFNELKDRLEKTESSFQTRMGGKTTGGLAGSLVLTLAWSAVFVVAALEVRGSVNGTLLLVSCICAAALIVFMIIDIIMDYSYYGRIASYKNAVSQLRDRVTVGQSSIKANYNDFLRSRAKGWNYPLKAASSIPDEAAAIEASINSMESLKKGFVYKAKTVSFFATVIAVSVVGSITLFPIGANIIMGITKQAVPDNTLRILNMIAMVLVCVGEIILAKFFWSFTNCNVTGVTPFAIALAPAAYLVLVSVATLVVMLVIWAVSILLVILGIVVVGATASAASSGG